MSKKVKLTVLILDFFKAEKVVKNVEFLRGQVVDFDFKIVVIDNSASDENSRILRKIPPSRNFELVINDKNLGYTRGHNAVAERIEGDFVLILNPDVEFRDPRTLKMMVDFMNAHPGVGIIGPKQVAPDGRIEMTVRAFPKFRIQVARRTFLRRLPWLNRRVDFDEMRHLDYSRTQTADWIQSSCVLIRRDLWDQIGGFDEDYFLFMGDVEICRQAWKKGFEVVFVPQIQVFADGIRCSDGGFRKFFKSWALRQHVRDALKYQMKHLGERSPREEFFQKNTSSVANLAFRPNMKGVILAGGAGTRLDPLTRVTSKQLLPVFDQPMIFYPIQTLIRAGIKEILIIVAPENAGDFLNLLGSGKEFGVRFTYEIQEKPDGIAQAFLIGENFIGRDNATLILGDNIFEDDLTAKINSFESGARIFLKKVADPTRFGVVEFDSNQKVISIEEKPKKPRSDFAQTGIYICDNTAIQKTKNLKPSARGELEITDLMKKYLAENALEAEVLTGRWFDCGTRESLFEAATFARGQANKKS